MMKSWIFFSLGILLYCSIPFFAQRVSADPAVIWLVGFYAATMMIFTMYGGGFATIPAYLADMFGTLHVGGIHGRLLTAWATAGVLGPVAITQLRQNSLESAIFDLAKKYKQYGMAAYSRLQQQEFDSEKEGYTATKHQREVGTSYFDAVSKTISSGESSTTAMKDSTEADQF